MDTQLFFSRDVALIPIGGTLYPIGGEPTIKAPAPVRGSGGTPIIPPTVLMYDDGNNTPTFEQPLIIPAAPVKGGSIGDIVIKTGVVEPIAIPTGGIKPPVAQTPATPVKASTNKIIDANTNYKRYFKIAVVILIIIVLIRIFK